MNTMQGFHASISAASNTQNPYLKALVEITRITHRQMDALVSDLGWQNWGEQNQETAAA